MKGRAHSAGFTIFEVMIVFAVTAGIFAAIVGTMSIRQRSNEFTQAVQDAKAQIQQVISEVQAGHYPDMGTYDCRYSGSGIKIDAGATTQGSHEDCIFLGSVIQFGIGSDQTEYRVMPIAARADATDLSGAAPQVIFDVSSSFDTTTGYKLKYGLSVASVSFTGGSGQLGAVGILSSLTDTSSGSSGVQQIDVYGMRNTKMGDAYGTSTISQVNNALNNSSNMVLNPASGFRLCLASAGTDQSGLITIGGGNRQLAVDLKVYSNKTCSP